MKTKTTAANWTKSRRVLTFRVLSFVHFRMPKIPTNTKAVNTSIISVLEFSKVISAIFLKRYFV
jgi:hypothetical protein